MTGRQSLRVRVARGVQRIPLSWLRPLEAPLVRRRARSGDKAHLIFLLALPRSGSTLTYQSLIHGLQPLYLSNLWNLLYSLPYLGGVLSGRRCDVYRSDFRSQQGFVEGLCGPAEGLRFWSYWTGSGLDERVPSAVSRAKQEKRVDYLRQVATALTDPHRPLVAGYLGHILIADALRRWFPEAVFVRLRRDPLSTAASILKCRQRGGTKNWFSVFPEECRDVEGRGMHEEVAAQVYWLNRRLDALDSDIRTVDLGYEELCADPSGSVDRIAGECGRHGMRLKLQQSLPATFEYRRVTPDDGEDAALLWGVLRQLQAQHGELASGTRRS